MKTGESVVYSGMVATVKRVSPRTGALTLSFTTARAPWTVGETVIVMPYEVKSATLGLTSVRAPLKGMKR